MQTILAYWGVLAFIVVVAGVLVFVYLNNRKKAKALLDKALDK